MICPFLLDLIFPSKKLSIERGRLFTVGVTRYFLHFSATSSTPDGKSVYLSLANILSDTQTQVI